MRRYTGLDVMRGIGILLVVFLHSSCFHYADITGLDFENPQPVVIVIGLLLMFSAAFVLLSGIVNTCSTVLRHSGSGKPDGRGIARDLVVAGIGLIIMHFIYFLVVGPVLLDLDGGHHKYALISGLIHNGVPALPHFDRVFYNTSMSAMGFNLIVTGIVMWMLSRRQRPLADSWNVAAAAVAGNGLIALSCLRIWLYPTVEASREAGNWPVFIVVNFLAGKNDPVFPYLGVGLLGASMGLLLACGKGASKGLEAYLRVGWVWLVLGIAGFLLFPDTMLEREIDWMWFAVTMLQTGLFTILAVIAVRGFGPGSRAAGLFGWATLAGRMSLTVFMLETPLSELLARLAGAAVPGWNHSIPLMIVFGFLNVLLWLGILFVWRKSGCFLTAEWWWVKAMKLAGRESGKLKILRTPQSVLAQDAQSI